MTTTLCSFEGFDVVRPSIRREQPRPPDEVAGADRLDHQRSGRRVQFERNLALADDEELVGRVVGVGQEGTGLEHLVVTAAGHQVDVFGLEITAARVARRADRGSWSWSLFEPPVVNAATSCGEVDGRRAPGDAPTATDAAGLAELIPPGRQLVGQPLAIPRAGVTAHAARAVERRMAEREARVPPLDSIGPITVERLTSSTALQKQVGHTSVQLVHDRQRSATSSQWGWSRLAMSTSRAASGSSRRVHPHLGRGDDPLPRIEIVVGRVTPRDHREDLVEHLRAAFRGDLDEQLVAVAVEQFGQCEVMPCVDRRTGAHRRAEAGRRRAAAVDADEERLFARPQYDGSGCGPSRNTWSCTAIAANSHARTPRNA